MFYVNLYKCSYVCNNSSSMYYRFLRLQQLHWGILQVLHWCFSSRKLHMYACGSVCVRVYVEYYYHFSLLASTNKHVRMERKDTHSAPGLQPVGSLKRRQNCSREHTKKKRPHRTKLTLEYICKKSVKRILRIEFAFFSVPIVLVVVCQTPKGTIVLLARNTYKLTLILTYQISTSHKKHCMRFIFKGY